MSTAHKKFDLIGRRFRNLTVVSYAGLNDSKKNSKWNCICDCGRKSVVTRPALIKEEFRVCECTNSPIIRFNKAYIINGECWEWQRAIRPNGYGQLCLNGKAILAHRASWILFKGEIPEGMCVCHTCDNRKCVNPDHLWLGTCKDNLQDMVKKGRSLTGLKNPNGKIDTKLHEEISNKYKRGINQYALAREYKVKQITIYRILHRFFPVLENLDGENNGMSKLTKEIVVECRELRKDGFSFNSLARKFNVNPSTIERAVKKITWSSI